MKAISWNQRKLIFNVIKEGATLSEFVLLAFRIA